MRLIITRHGETEENKARIIQGHLPGKLSDIGINQAKKVAERLKNEKIDYILTSDLARATDTARIIAKFHKKVPFKLTKNLRERYMGELQGNLAPKNWSTKKYDLKLNKKIGGEGWEELYERAKLFLENILQKFKGKTLLLVAHNQIDQAIILNLLNKPWEKVKKMEKLGNTSVSEFEIEEKKVPFMKVFDCTNHLNA
jgi:broad specificity phosphatase PhoE